MSRLERLLPIILSILLPGLNIISNNHVEDYINPAQVFPKYLLIVCFLYSVWRLNDFFLDNPRWVFIKTIEFKFINPVLVLINLIYIALFVWIDFFFLPDFLSLSMIVPPWMVAFRLIIAVLVFIVFQQALKTTKQRESLYVQNLTLQTEKLKFELESMKQQINPHFLFNSLNTLIDLIEEDQKKAVRFVRIFSNLYRVVLQSSRRDFILLEDELKFLTDYWELLKIRFNGAVNLVIHIPEDKFKALIPPLSLQFLIENAVKHNKATNDNPLFIEIYEYNNSIVIQNKISPKRFAAHGEGLGLKNLQKRFSLLFSPIEYSVENELFKVILPLKEA